MTGTGKEEGCLFVSTCARTMDGVSIAGTPVDPWSSWRGYRNVLRLKDREGRSAEGNDYNRAFVETTTQAKVGEGGRKEGKHRETGKGRRGWLGGKGVQCHEFPAQKKHKGKCGCRVGEVSISQSRPCPS